MQITDLLTELGYKTVDDGFYNLVDVWKSWYKGKVADFHNYKVYNGEEYVKMEKYTMGMAKTVSEDWANYIFNNDTVIRVENDNINDILHQYMKKINFQTNMSQLVEAGFANGTVAVTIVDDNNGIPDLDFIREARMIFPLTWDNGEIIDCCFGSYKFFNGKKYLYLNIHNFINNMWTIKNRFFEIDNDNVGAEVYFDGVATEYTSDIKRYFIFKPAVINNYSYDNPMGVSIFGNAIDNLKGIDTVYDSYINEFVLGRKRIIASADVVKTSMKDGSMKPTFDPSDVTFYAMPANLAGDNLIKEIDMNLRVEQHKQAMQDMLNMLSVKIGMGTKHYSFTSGAVTATEIKSTTDTLYNSMVKHEMLLGDMLSGLLKSVLSIMGYSEQDVTVEFSDAVIHDRNAELLENIQLLQNGIIDKAEVRSWWTGADLETSRQQIKEIEAGQTQSDLFGATM